MKFFQISFKSVLSVEAIGVKFKQSKLHTLVRAFASAFTIAGGLPTDGLYFAGGYSTLASGFIDTGKIDTVVRKIALS